MEHKAQEILPVQQKVPSSSNLVDDIFGTHALKVRRGKTRRDKNVILNYLSYWGDWHWRNPADPKNRPKVDSYSLKIQKTKSSSKAKFLGIPQVNADDALGRRTTQSLLPLLES